MKYSGVDAGEYLKIEYEYDQTTGYNITKISVTGFTGDPTDYTDAFRVCNYGSGQVQVRLHAVGEVGNGQYVQFIKDFRVYPVGQSNDYVGFSGSTVARQYSNWYAVAQNTCASFSVYVLVDANIYDYLANNNPADLQKLKQGKLTLATYQVNVEFKIG